jgi:alpha-L-fucosidase
MTTKKFLLHPAAVLFLAAIIFRDEAFAQDGPHTTPEIVAQAAEAGAAVPPGKFLPTWDSIRANYSTPDWLRDAKFGLFMHWGLYVVPAHGSEWYEKHMYGNPGITQWHTEHFGAPDKFGYKDFIPLFTCSNWNPGAWAELFKKSGAKFVIPTAEHHDGFALWNSTANRFNAVQMGPHRDLIGDLGRAVRKQGLKFGVSNHGIEHFTFIQPTKGVTNDLFDPQWKDFYSVADRSDAACEKFLESWVAQNIELIDQYQPDVLWFDNGVNRREFDAIKLKVAAYYYNRAATWGKQVSLSTKDSAYLAGSYMDFERGSRAPKELTDYPWFVDEPVLYRFGYTEGSPIADAAHVVRLLVDCTSKNGGLLLNISPKADGTIPDDQQKLLLQIGAWLDVNGEAIYGTRPWKQFSEGKIRFTTKGKYLYAISYEWPANEISIASLARTNSAGNISSVELLGHRGALEFSQDESGLKIKLPAGKPCDYAYAFKISGLNLK